MVPQRPDPARQSAYSDPGQHVGLLLDLPDDVPSLEAAARNVIVHYRAQLTDVGPDRDHEINSRWLERILDLDQARFGTPLTAERPVAGRVAGCCRDHTLLVVGALRARGVPARSRVGFSRYFAPDWAFDHVVVEYFDGARWIRTDPELAAGDLPGTSQVDVDDLGAGPTSPFISAADAWLAHRREDLDLARFGVHPDAGSGLSGRDFVRSYVLMQLAHRYGDEMLLWDQWRTLDPEAGDVTDDDVDHLAEMLVRCDSEEGTTGAGRVDDDLYQLYREDRRLRPGDVVVQASPLAGEPVRVVLAEARPAARPQS